MTPERFRILTAAYGADLGRWPEAERSEAAQFATQNSPELALAMRDAAMLDELLASHIVVAADQKLFANIIASAPQKHTGFWQEWSWSSIGLLGAGFAGAVAGAFCVSIWMSGMLPESTESVGGTAMYVDFGNDWIS
ncbi:MAG: hypothetical protein WC696_04980 [Candidatus Methylopumilus sp.]|jgi:hypothetical protein